MPNGDKASPVPTRRPRVDSPPRWPAREAARLDRSRRLEAVIAALARVRRSGPPEGSVDRRNRMA